MRLVDIKLPWSLSAQASALSHPKLFGRSTRAGPSRTRILGKRRMSPTFGTARSRGAIGSRAGLRRPRIDDCDAINNSHVICDPTDATNLGASSRLGFRGSSYFANVRILPGRCARRMRRRIALGALIRSSLHRRRYVLWRRCGLHHSCRRCPVARHDHLHEESSGQQRDQSNRRQPNDQILSSIHDSSLSV